MEAPVIRRIQPIYRSIGLCSAVLLGSALTEVSPATAEEKPPPQLYVFTNPTPKWGYIEADSESDGQVQFRECDSPQPISVERARLKRADGDCEPDRGHGTWVATLERRANGMYVLKPTAFTAAQGGEVALTSTEWGKLLAESGLPGHSFATGDYVGITEFAPEKNVFAVEEIGSQQESDSQ